MVAIPLPSPANEPAEGWIMGGLKNVNALQRQNMENQYYGPLAQAEVASKTAYANYLPYQLQAQMMSNPMIWMGLEQLKKTNPQAADNYLHNLMQSIPPPQSFQNQGQNGSNPQFRNNVMGLLGNIFNGNSQGNGGNALNSSGPPPQAGSSGGYAYGPNGKNETASPAEVASIAQNGNGMPSPGSSPGSSPAPAPSSAMAPGGIGPKMIAPYQQSPYPAGTTVNTGDKIFTTPDSQTVQNAQQSILSINNLKPVLNNISKGAEKWLAPGASGKIKTGQVLGVLEQTFGTLGGVPDKIREQAGITKRDVSDYAKWKSQQQTALEMIVKARNWANNEDAQHRVAEIIQPIPGEGPEYGQRVAEELQQLTESTQRSAQALTQGISLDQDQAPSAAQPAPAPAPAPSAPVEGGQVMWNVYSPQGKIVAKGTTDNVNAFLKDHRGYYRKKI